MWSCACELARPCSLSAWGGGGAFLDKSILFSEQNPKCPGGSEVKRVQQGVRPPWVRREQECVWGRKKKERSLACTKLRRTPWCNWSEIVHEVKDLSLFVPCENALREARDFPNPARLTPTRTSVFPFTDAVNQSRSIDPFYIILARFRSFLLLLLLFFFKDLSTDRPNLPASSPPASRPVNFQINIAASNRRSRKKSDTSKIHSGKLCPFFSSLVRLGKVWQLSWNCAISVLRNVFSKKYFRRILLWISVGNVWDVSGNTPSILIRRVNQERISDYRCLFYRVCLCFFACH